MKKAKHTEEKMIGVMKDGSGPVDSGTGALGAIEDESDAALKNIIASSTDTTKSTVGLWPRRDRAAVRSRCIEPGQQQQPLPWNPFHNLIPPNRKRSHPRPESRIEWARAPADRPEQSASGRIVLGDCP